MFSKETYQNRRKALKERVGSGVIVLMGNELSPMNYEDNTYEFVQDRTFTYFTGRPEESLTLVIDIDNDREILFGNELTIDDIVWMGAQPTLREKAEMSGLTDIRPTKDIEAYLKEAQSKGRKIHYLPPYRPEHRVKLHEWLNVGLNEAQPSVDLIRAVVDLRNHKTAEELEVLERACDITADMHMEAMRLVRPGMKEYEVRAAVEAVAYRNGGRPSFPTISTTHGQTLHNHHYTHTLNPGDMLLLDCGAEIEDGYCGDMSSTMPVNKKFTDRQKTIYDIQVASHRAAVDMLKPGVPFVDVYEKSAETVVEGLKALGIMKGDAKEAVAAGAHAMFYPCGLGHMMGLDVHDMENLGEVWVGYDGKPKSTQFGRKSLRLARPLEPGFVLTIEPGVYFIPELIDYWGSEKRHSDFIDYTELNKWRDFSGIRNEEDYVITETGARRLGKKKPITTEEVEALHS